jgi:2-iminobutanoate/2-iminopropanoate deaminase
LPVQALGKKKWYQWYEVKIARIEHAYSFNRISHAVVANNMCFVSGQLSVNEQGDYQPGSLKDESTLAFQNFFSSLKAAGFSKKDLVFVDIAFADISGLEEVNALFSELFPIYKRPARTVYQVSALPYGAKIKVMGTAVKSD